MVRYITVLCGVLLTLTACATYWDGATQDIAVLTPGASDARCTLVAGNDESRVMAYPPRPVTVRRSAEPLTITCAAPGNREKTVLVYSDLNDAATANVFHGGAGAAVDQVSGALYEYPKSVVVDFRNTRARIGDLPKYHNNDTISPFDTINEDMSARNVENPADQGLMKTPPAPESTQIEYSKESPAPEDLGGMAPAGGVLLPY